MNLKIMGNNMQEEIKPIDAFFKIVSDLPDWQQDIILRIKNDGLSSVLYTQLDDIVLMAKAAHKIPLPTGAIAPTPVKITRGILPEDLESDDNVIIKKISDIKNVNALAESGIEFTIADDARGAGLTIIYGRNGSGKSGYIRILKAVSAAKNIERAFPHKNCFKNDPTPSSAKIHIGGGEYVWNEGDAGNSFARKIRIFDKSNAEIYTHGEGSDKRTEIVYAPHYFSWLDDLATILGAVRTRLTEAQATLPNPYSFVNRKLQDNGITKIELTPNTPAEIITDFLSCNDDKEKRWQEIKAVIDGAKELQAKKRLLKNIIESSTDLFRKIEDLLSADKIKELFAKHAEKKGHGEALKELRKNTEENNPLHGACSPAWDSLWKSAVEFMGGAFPSNGDADDTCPLCMQAITGSAKERITKFHTWVSNDIKKKYDIATAFIAQKKEALGMIISRIEMSAELSEALEIDQVQKEIIGSFFANAKENWETMKEKIVGGNFQEQDYKEVKICDQLFGNTEAKTEVEKLGFVGQLGKDITKLSEPPAADKIALYENLKTTKICCHFHEQVKGFKAYDETFANYGKAIKNCATTSITTAKTNLSRTFLNDKFDRLVESERIFFGLPYKINFAFSGQQGKSMHALKCDGASLSPADFMSEGELKIASMSCFLAEYGMLGAKIPLVFDDPITSLDHEFYGQVVKRLTALAAETQVIVFTHNLVFSNALRKQFPASNVVRLKSDKTACVAGIVNDGEWEDKNIQEKIDFIRVSLLTIPDDNHIAIRKCGGDIREIWEQAVEDKLFNKTITRFEKDVQTERLEQVIIDDEIYPMIQAGMTKTSEWANHNTAEANDARIAKTDVEAELSKVEAFVKTVGEKQVSKIQRVRSSVRMI